MHARSARSTQLVWRLGSVMAPPRKRVTAPAPASLSHSHGVARRRSRSGGDGGERSAALGEWHRNSLCLAGIRKAATSSHGSCSGSIHAAGPGCHVRGCGRRLRACGGGHGFAHGSLSAGLLCQQRGQGATHTVPVDGASQASRPGGAPRGYVFEGGEGNTTTGACSCCVLALSLTGGLSCVQDPVSRHKFDLTGLMLPNSAYLFRDTMVWFFPSVSRPGSAACSQRQHNHHAQTDAEHDSVHARTPPPPSPAKVSGRQLDQGKTAKAAVADAEAGAVSTPRGGFKPKSTDEYDFWVNVCTPSVGMPPVCEGKGPAAGYQVVVPKEEEHSDEEELQMFDDYERRAIAREKALQDEEAGQRSGGGAGESQGGGGEGQPKQLHRAARGRPEARECHALGGLDNVTWSVITPRAPAHGVSLTYHGGDQCMKRVVTRSTPPPAEKLNSWKKPNKPDAAAVGGIAQTTEVQWVPVPRTLTLHIRCDPEDTGVRDFATFLQLTRRVRVVETEMCEYVVEWPSALGCGTPPRGKALRAATALVHPRRWVWWLLAAGAAVLGTQLKRQWHALAILRPALMRGDAAAWHRAKAIILSKARLLVEQAHGCVCTDPCSAPLQEASVRARPRYSKMGHEV